MDATTYTTLTRQSGLLREMDTIANNIANMSTNGYRRAGLVFSEYVHVMEPGTPSLSMAHANVRSTDTAQGALSQSAGDYDFAIEGDGFFLLETADGEALTRAGSFSVNDAGDLVAPDGARLLDTGGAAIFVPPDAKQVTVATDGTLSVDGRPLSQIGLYLPEDQNSLNRTNGTRFATEGALVPVDEPVILQGFIENSNVDPVSEIARMIEVQRSYELGQTFLEREDERLRQLMESIVK